LAIYFETFGNYYVVFNLGKDLTINDNTPVIEVAHDNNRSTFVDINFLPAIKIEYNGMTVTKNDTIFGIETPATILKHIEFTLKNTGTGALMISGVATVNVTSDAFSVAPLSG
jgi:hypothetical protein